MKEDVENSARRHALKNAIQHDGEAEVEAVLGGVMSDHGELEPKNIIDGIQDVVDDINDLPLEDQKQEAEELGIKLKGEREDGSLPEIPQEGGEVITRAAPNPNGPFHLGNSRANILSYLYAERNDGRFVLRFDDTDPSTPEKSPKKKFYRWIEEDLEWLGCKPDLVVRASERLDVYYEFAYDLIVSGKAYVCTCDPKEWKGLRDDKKPCPCRNLSVKKHEDRWQKMQDGSYEEGEAVVRIKTDIEHDNPARRDWPALRILKDHDHPYVSEDYVVWPLYNFASAIDDYELNITHIFRAKEHSTNTENQKDLYEHFGWEYPTTIHHGFLSLKGTILSTSKMRKGIESGKFIGWDDPRLGTIRAFKRRGFKPETFHKIIRKFGPKNANAEVSMEEFTSINRKVVDAEANRYFFVESPVKVEVENGKKKKVELRIHPEKKDTRELEAGKSFYIEEKDLETNRGKVIRLKGLYNIKIPEKGNVCKYSGNDIVQEMPKVHWLPGEGNETTDAEIMMPDGEKVKGPVEKNVLEEDRGEVLQFERFGFVRLDRKTGKAAEFWFTHR
ncbi:MAG: glutamate--tRNA ligase [Candidatus Aenigmatarchaeota archaeon]